MSRRFINGRSSSNAATIKRSETAILTCMMNAVGLSSSSSSSVTTMRRGPTSSSIPSSNNHLQRRSLSQNGHAWLGSLRYGFPFAPQLGSFSLQYGKVSDAPEKATTTTADDAAPTSDATSTAPQRRVKMMKRPPKELCELDIDDDAGLKFSFSHSASIRGVKGDVRVADMIIARRQVATKALLRLKVLEMASCARGDVRALFRGLTKDFEREKQEVIDSFWAQIPEDNMNWEGAGAGGGGDIDDHPTAAVAGTSRFDSQRVLNDILAAIDSDHKSCRQREGEHLDRITEVEASLLEMLDGTEANTLPSSTCHLLRYLDSTRERVELIFSKKIDSVVQLFVLYHQKRQMHDAENRLLQETGIAAITGTAPTPTPMAICHNLFTPAGVAAKTAGSKNGNSVDIMTSNNVNNNIGKDDPSSMDDGAGVSSTEACKTAYSATSKAIGKLKREAPQHDVADAPIATSTTTDETTEETQEELLRSRISGEDLIRDQQRRIYCRSLQEEVDEVENRWAVRRLERDERWRALNERMTSTAATPPPSDAMTGSLFLSAAAELGVLDKADWEATAIVAEHSGAEGSPRLSTTEEAEEEEDENGGRRGTSELDELVLQDALIYSRALVFASGGSRTARDWIAGAGTLSSSNPALVRIALQHHGTLRDLQMFVSLCEVTACTHTSITERVTALCEEAIASGDSAQSAACRRIQLASDSEDAVRVVCGNADEAAEILSPTSLLAEHIIFKEERRAQQESEEAAAAAGGGSSSSSPIHSMADCHHRTNTNHHPASGQGVNESVPEGSSAAGEESLGAAAHATTAQEYFYAKTPYSGVSGPSSGTSHTNSSNNSTSASGSGRRAAFARCFNAKQCAIISSQPLDLEFGDHSDFDPTPASKTTTATVSSSSSSRRQDSSEDEPLSVELPIPFTPQEQVNILKRCLVYDSLCAACFMQPQWSLRNTRTLNTSHDEDEEDNAISTLSTIPGSVSVDEGQTIEEESESTIDLDEEDGEGIRMTVQQEDDARHSRIVFTNDEGGDSHNQSRVLGRHPSAMVREDLDTSRNPNETATQSVINAGGSTNANDDEYPADDTWMNHPLYVRYFGASGKRIQVPAAVPNGSPAASSGMSYTPNGVNAVGVGAANDRHVRRALACARRLEVDPEVVAELLSVVLEEESIVSAKQRVVGDLGGSAENATTE